MKFLLCFQFITLVFGLTKKVKVGLKVHQHQSRSGMDLEVGKQTAALLRLALLSGGSATMLYSGSPELSGVLSVLAQMGGLDWSKVLILSVSEYFGLPQHKRGSVQFDLCDKFFSIKPDCPITGLINGEGIPSKELVRLNHLIERHKPDVFLTSIGAAGEIGLIENNSGESEEIAGYRIVELSETFRRGQFNQQLFKSINEVPRKGISLSLAGIFSAKHVVCCLSGKSKSDLASKLIYQKDLPDTCEGFLKHPDVHLHLDPESGSTAPPTSGSTAL